MSRNRIKNSQSLHWMGVLKWVLVVGLILILGLSYMLCKNRNLNLAEETRKLQNELDALQRRNSELALDLQRMKSPSALARRLLVMKSDLVALGDPRLVVIRKDQNLRMRLARMGTLPSTVNMDPTVVSTDAGDTTH
jgi:hypothetical protein